MMALLLTLAFVAFPARAIHMDCERLTLADGPGVAIERRAKILTESQTPAGQIPVDSPDPSAILPFVYPDGRQTFRIWFTGMRFIEAEAPEYFFRGGTFRIRVARGFYPDGTEMTDAQSGESRPWDVVIYTNAFGEQIAHGGAMPQPGPGLLPDMRHNPSRSRWWGKVVGEDIHWQGPIHDYNRVPGVSTWSGHGYGGSLLTFFNRFTGRNELFRQPNGNYLLYYERVTAERDGRPLTTTMFARELDPSLTNAVGEEVMVTDLVSPVTGQFFKATKRSGPHESYLAEGGNVLFELGRNQVIKAWSANDFFGRYGIFLDYRPPGGSPLGPFKPVIDREGELIDFADTLGLREMLKATWIGRPLLEYAPDGKLWLRFHYVSVENLPPGAPREGLPPPELAFSYPRFSAQIPVRFEYDEQDQPRLVWDR